MPARSPSPVRSPRMARLPLSPRHQSPHRRPSPVRALALVAAAAAAFGAPAGLAGSAAAQSRSISQSDRAEGAQAHPDLVAEFGGAMSGPQAAYVAEVGKRIAVQSGLGNARADFTVTLLNSPINNAFAIPGGYVYATRDLVSLMNSEAELAAVLGHEIGHVAARHSAKRQNTATRNTIFGALGQILSGVVFGSGALGQIGQQLFSTGTQLLTLQYSRRQETEADNLGIRYLRGAGYDPRALATMLDTLARQTALDARLLGNSASRAPAWASTHPDPAARVRAAGARAGANPGGVTHRDPFLNRLDGIMYGDDPAQGVVEGRSFVHPRYRFAFQAPSGFYLVNGTRSVTIGGQSAKGQLATAAFNGNLDSYVRSAFAGLTQGSASIPVGAVQRTVVNGLPAAFAVAPVNTGSGEVEVAVFAYALANDQAFHFITVAAPGNTRVFEPMFASMRRISAGEAAGVRPRRIDVHKVRPGETLQSLAQRMAYPSYRLERFLVLNGLAADSRLVPGQRVKLVVS